jgi:MFS family permease
MSQSRFKLFCFTLEGINSFAATLFLNYLFFFLRDHFSFGNRQNLWVCALHGFIYIFAAWQGGKFGQRHGYLNALKVGYGGAAVFLAVGALLTQTILGELVVVAGWTAMICFTWPALEALVSEGEDEASLPRMVGIYNVVWAGAAALAYFCGGAILDALGWKTLFWLPALLFVAQFITALWLDKNHDVLPQALKTLPPHRPAAAAQQTVSPATFLKMAWLSNPFAYIAANTVLAVIPQLAARLNLTVAASGLFCSAWLFARLAAFVVLWRWTGWHYRFRWLLAAFLALIVGFATLLFARNLWALIAAQLVFGAAVGLLYYSSLFYAMDVGEDTQGEHGGMHEAFIGAGIFAGPCVGATALQFFPRQPDAGTWAVTVLLLGGLGGLAMLRQRGAKKN